MPRVKLWVILSLAVALGAGAAIGRIHLSSSVGAPVANAERTDAASSGALVSEGGPHSIFVSLPEGPPRVLTSELDAMGRPVTVSCVSCHTSMEPNRARRSAADPPMQFHQGLTFAHGQLSCVSCHNPNDYNTLRLADGAAVPYPDVMTMCSQCHAPQARDWANGAHGGMTGYWDLSRGPRHRKSCIDCHDPHAPAFPSMTPTFKPIDRFLTPLRTGGAHE